MLRAHDLRHQAQLFALTFEVQTTGGFMSRFTKLFLLAVSILVAPAAHAQNAAAAFNAYNSAYLVQANGQTYYAGTLASAGTTPEGEWQQALDIQVALDAYQYTHSQADLDLVTSLLNSLTYYNGPGSLYGNWQTDGWDDNLGWMVNVYLRGYELTGNSAYLAEAEAGWTNGYNQGWDTTVAGGGIWENTNYQSKCALSNDPFVWEGVQLYVATGTASYLTKAEAIYAWVRSNLANTTSSSNSLGAPGQVNGCVGSSGQLQGNSDNVYDAGGFVEAAATLYHVTGNSQYYNDAVLTINHIVGEGSVIPYDNSGENGHQWAYWFTRGLSDFATEANLWGTYQTWMQSNANAAWNERDTNLNITWNDWTNATNTSNSDPNEMSSAAAIWQHLPPYNPPTFTGNYEFQNAASNLALSVEGSSTASSAPIIQEPFDGGNEALWIITPTSGGYFQIANVNSGLLLGVSAASGISGAGIVQSPAQGMTPGNDQWTPSLNSDGTYSFFNLNSLQVLDNPSASTASGTQFDQSFAKGTPSQKFYLIPQSATSTSAPTTPTPPTALSATVTSSNVVNLSWTASATSGAAYAIFRSTTSGFPPSSSNRITTAPASATTFADSSASASTTYYYLVEATDTNGTSAASNEASATTATPSFLLTLSSPSLSVTAGASGTDTITVTPQDGLPTSASISFACSGQPASVTCSFSPTTVTSGNIVSVLTVTATKTSSALHSMPGPLFPASALAAALGFLGWGKRRRLQLMLLAVSLFGMTLFTGCGGSSSAASTSTATPMVYPVQVTATYTPASGSTVTQTALLEVVTTQ